MKNPQKKNLCAKDEIIKKFVETQYTVLKIIAAKSKNQHSKTLNQSSSSLPSNNLNENPHFTKQLTSQEGGGEIAVAGAVQCLTIVLQRYITTYLYNHCFMVVYHGLSLIAVYNGLHIQGQAMNTPLKYVH